MSADAASCVLSTSRAADVRDRFLKLAFDRGLLLLGCGTCSVRFRPVLTVSKEDIDQGLTIVEKVLAELG